MESGMANRFLQWMERRGSRRMIVRDEEDYLERYFIYRGPKLSIYLHRFWASDPDNLHDHPWWSLSYILKGGYREWFLDGTFKDRKKGDTVLRDASTFHRVELSEGAKPGSAWTFFFTWSRQRDWGFLTDDGWVAAKEYTEQPVEVHGRDFIFKGRIFPKMIKLEKGNNGASGDRVPADGQLPEEVQAEEG
jgi:hypothetical protein